MAKGDDLQQRFINFAVDIISLTSKLPNTPAGRHVGVQLLRSGTSPAPNYAEARGAESTKDFIHKMRIVLKELNESYVWLEIIKRSKMMSEPILKPVFNECVELSKITVQSISTAMKKNL